MRGLVPVRPEGEARRAVVLVMWVMVLAPFAACTRPVPSAPGPPGLEGQRVMLLPVRVGDPAELDTELAHRLPARGPTVEWLLPDELQTVMDRAPAWRVRLSAMPRNIAQPRSREPYLVDPTYGDLRRLGAIVDSHLAILPVAVRQVEVDGAPVLELTAALVDIRGGRVLWMATVRGGASPESPGDAAAAVAEALAGMLFPL
jgi:hypothetical protein